MKVEENFRGLTLADFSRPDVASECLSQLLREGELALLLGAGVSQSCGLPSWDDLVAGCEADLGDEPRASDADARTGDQLMAAMESVKRRHLSNGGTEGDFRELVRKHLYPEEYVANANYPDELLGRMMLIAVGALVMPSARGSVRDVVTLNFDDLVEWYLELHGFTTRSVADLPTNLSSQVDTTVFHAHGYLPLRPDTSPTEWMVLTRKEFIKRVARTGDSVWPRFLGHLFSTKVLLVVGARLEDIDLAVHFEESREGQEPGRIAGFVINASFEAGARADLLEQGFVPVEVGSYEQVPHFLLEVCRKASRAIRVS